MRKIGFVMIALLGLNFSGIAQEIDDMYFNSSDRKKARKEAKKRQSAVEFQSPDAYQFSDDEFIESSEGLDEVMTEVDQMSLQYQSPYNSTNIFTNYPKDPTQKPLEFNYQQEAYDQGYEDGFNAANTPMVNNYYGNGFNNGWNGGLGFNTFYDPWFGWGNRWNVGIGWGWGGGFGLYDPWFNDPFYGWGRPFASVGWGWNRPWGWGLNRPWGGGWWCPNPLYDWGGNYIVSNTPSKEIRRTQRGPRAGMGSTTSSTGTRSSNRGTGLVSGANNGDYATGTRTTNRTNSDGRSQVSRMGDAGVNQTYTRRTGAPQNYERRTTQSRLATPQNGQSTNRRPGTLSSRNNSNPNAYRSNNSSGNRGVNLNMNRSNRSKSNNRSYSNRSNTRSSSSSVRSSSGSSKSSSGSSRSSSRSSSRRGN